MPSFSEFIVRALQDGLEVKGRGGDVAITPTDPTGGGVIHDRNFNAVVAGDLQIRDTNAHFLVVPVSAEGYSALTVSFRSLDWDQSLTLTVYQLMQRGPALTEAGQLAQFTVPTSAIQFTLGAGAVGQGGVAGGATAADQAHYSIPSLADCGGYIAIRLEAGVAPTAGEFSDITFDRV